MSTDLQQIEEALSEESVYNETWLEWDYRGEWMVLSRAAVGETLETPAGRVTKVHEEFPDDETRGESVMVFQWYDEFYQVTGYQDSYDDGYWYEGCQRVYPHVQPVVVYKTKEN